MVLFVFYFFGLSPQANRWHSVKIDCLLVLIWINFGKHHWRRKWPPTTVFLPGEFHGQRSLVGYSPQGRQESDTTKWLTHQCHWVHFQILTKPRKFKDEFEYTFPFVIHVSMLSCSVLSDSLQPHGLYSPCNSPGQNTGVGSLFLLQGIFPTQGLNSGLPHCRQILHQLSRQGRPRILEWVVYPFSGRSSWPRNQTGVSFIAGRFFTSWAAREALRLVCNWIQADPWTTWVCTVRVHLHRRFFFSK